MDRHRIITRQGRGAVSSLSLAVWVGLVAFFFPQAVPARDAAIIRTAQAAHQGLTVEAQDVVGEIGQSIPLRIAVREVAPITVESITLLGLPPGFIVRDGTHTLRPEYDSEILNLSGWSVTDLRIEQLDRRVGRFPISLVLSWKLRHTDLVEVSVADFTVDITSEPPALVESTARNGALEPPAARNAEPPAFRNAEAPSPISGPVPRSPPVGDPPASPPSLLGAAPPAMPSAPWRGNVVSPPESTGGARRIEPPPVPAAPTGSASFVERAKGLIGRGDISGARLFLERARLRDEPDATYLLAQTWDPEMLRQWNVRGLRPDPDKARALYREAGERKPVDERLTSATRR